MTSLVLSKSLTTPSRPTPRSSPPSSSPPPSFCYTRTSSRKAPGSSSSSSKMPSGKRSASEGKHKFLKRKRIFYMIHQSARPSNVQQLHRLQTTRLPIFYYLPTQIIYLHNYTKLIPNKITYLYTYLTHPLPISDMDTSSALAKKSIRASLTAPYEARVASTLEKVDPNRAKA